MNIKEIIITPNDKIFAEFALHHPHIIDWTVSGLNKWHFVFLDNNPQKCIHISGYSENTEFRKDSFESVYNSLKNKQFSNLLLLTTYYGRMDSVEMVKKINEPKKELDLFTSFLCSSFSNGYLAYSHQLEQVYSAITGASSEVASQFRKDWNKKKREVIADARNIQYSKNMSLYDYISENSFSENESILCNANYHYAKTLFDYFSK